jgi:hypothetical protein
MAVDAPWVVSLYGSHARGEADPLSDRDILRISDQPSTKGNAVTASDASSYTWNEFETMHSYGSLFLLHLSRESLVLESASGGEVRYRNLLATLPKYNRAERDIASFQLAIDDVEQSIQEMDTSPVFELSVLATTIRHASIVGCYLTGDPVFGRYSAVSTFTARRGLDYRIGNEFPLIYQYKMCTARNSLIDQRIAGSESGQWIRWARELIGEVERCRTLSHV